MVERWGERGGAQEVALNLAAQLQADGHVVDLVLLNGGDLGRDAAERGVTVRVMRLWRDHLAGLPAFTVRLVRDLRRDAVDLVIANGTSLRLFLGPATRVAGVALVWNVYDPMRQNTRRRRMLSRLQSWITPDVTVLYGPAAQRSIPSLPGKLGVRLDADPPIDIARLSAVVSDPREALGLGPDSRIVAMLARVAAHKGHLDLIAAFARLAGSFPETYLVMCGGMTEGEEYLAQVRAAIDGTGLGVRIRLTGHVSESLRNGLLVDADVVVHPAHTEPFGLPVIQAMAAGTPVIAAAAEGPARTLAGTGGGVLYPPGDRQALTSALELLLSDAVLRREMGRQGREEALAYSLATHTAALMAAVVEARSTD